MNSFTSPDFWQAYARLPADIRLLARKNYRLWKQDQRHPSLRFKTMRKNLWSARVGDHHRALAIRIEGGWLWFWIGNHADYERVIASYH